MDKMNSGIDTVLKDAARRIEDSVSDIQNIIKGIDDIFPEVGATKAPEYIKMVDAIKAYGKAFDAKTESYTQKEPGYQTK